MKEAHREKLSSSELGHLKRLGITAKAVKSTEYRPFKRLSAWWEGTAFERQLEDIDEMLNKFAFIDLLNVLASLTIIMCLGGWLWGSEEHRETERLNMRLAIESLPGDQSGVVRDTLERLHLNKYSLAGLPLFGANLRLADLRGANLREADLSRANLSGANRPRQRMTESMCLSQRRRTFCQRAQELRSLFIAA